MEAQRSLEAEEKERERALESDLASANSKARLRESMMSLSAKSALTKPERNFLQMLIDSESPGAAEACMIAHRTLMDGNLFAVICGGSAGEAYAPGHNWTSSSISSDRNENKGSGDWVEEWVSRGSQESGGENPEVDKGDLSATDKLVQPRPLTRKSSEARLSRLALRRKQSSSGRDGSRLFKAHEVGLSLTAAASARRSLQKIGLPMEKGNFMPPPPLNADGGKALEEEQTNAPFGLARIEGSPAVDSDKKTLEDPEPQPTSFEDALAKMDERTIRRIEKEERARQKAMEVDTTVMQGQLGLAGCVSPFSMGILEKMFASKQLSFRRESSSYTRYDSFLMSTDSIGEDDKTGSVTKEIESAGPRASESLTSSGIALPSNKDDIFRPSSRPRTHEERLENLLINAGLKGRNDDSEKLISTSPADEFVRSQSNSSVAILMKGGLEDKSVFRDKSNKQPELDTAIYSQNDEADQRTAGSDGSPDASSLIGDLPSESSFRARPTRRSTSSIMKSSASAATPRKGSYKRSVSWGSDVFKQDVSDPPFAGVDSSCSSRISVMSFPHLRRAGPLRSDSIGSISSAVLSIPPIRAGAPVRSNSAGSVSNASIFSGPSLHHATSIYSAWPLGRAPSLKLAHEIRSISQTTLGFDDDEEDSINSDEKPPKVLSCRLPPRPAQRGSSSNVVSRGVVIRNASNSQFYPGDGFEVEEVVHLDSARKMKSMVSGVSDTSIFSSASSRHLRRGSSVASHHSRALDDGFIVRDIAFERHASEILRSLSNEDLYSYHNNLDTIQRSSKNITTHDALSTMRVLGDESTGGESWDIDASTNTRAPLPTNAWLVLQDEYSYGYGGLGTLPFKILGTHAGDVSAHPHVLSPPLMESLQNFLPPQISETNFWLKYSLV